MDKAGTHMAVLTRQLNLFLNRELAGRGITASELPYLAQLYERDGLSQEDMARMLSVDRAAASRTLAALERKGLVVRGEDPGDRRARRVTLTDEGHELEPRIREVQVAWIAHVTQDMASDEAEAFGRQLARMAGRARELNGQEG